jgi:hypothetical protein
MSTEDTDGNEALERLRRQDDESDDAVGHKAGLSADPDFSHNLGVDRPEGEDDGAVEKHNYRR